MATIHTYSNGTSTTQLSDDAFSGFLADCGLCVVTTFLANTAAQQIRVFRLEEHLTRLLTSAAELAICSPIAEHKHAFIKRRLANAIADFAKHHPEFRQLRVRIILGPTELNIIIDQYTPRWSNYDTIKLHSLKLQRPLARHKLLGSPVSAFAARTAAAHGFDEALLLDEQGRALEGAWSNFFWFNRQGDLFTPEGALLPGITRKTIMELRKVNTALLPLAEILDSAAECFITQSTSGITPVCSIDDFAASHPIPGPHTQSLRQELQHLIAETSEQLNNNMSRGN